MNRSVRARLSECCKTNKTSPVNTLTLRLKDPELDKKYTQQDRLVCFERAKIYMSYLMCLLPLSLAFLASHKITFYFYAGETLVTILLVAGCLFASKFRIVAIEFILPLGVLVRALVKYFVEQKAAKDMICQSTVLNAGIAYVNVALFFIECINFRLTVYNYVFAIVAFLILSATNHPPKAYTDMPFCTDESNYVKLAWIGAVSFFVIPIFVSFSVLKYNELRLFCLHDTMTKQ